MFLIFLKVKPKYFLNIFRFLLKFQRFFRIPVKIINNIINICFATIIKSKYGSTSRIIIKLQSNC